MNEIIHQLEAHINHLKRAKESNDLTSFKAYLEDLEADLETMIDSVS